MMLGRCPFSISIEYRESSNCSALGTSVSRKKNKALPYREIEVRGRMRRKYGGTRVGGMVWYIETE